MVPRTRWFSECLSMCSSGLPSPAGVPGMARGLGGGSVLPRLLMPRGGDGRHLGRQPWRWQPWGESPGPILPAAPDLLLHTYPCSLGRKMSPGRPELLHGRWETRDQCFPSSPEVPSQPTFPFPPSRFLQFVCCIVFFLGGGCWGYT